MKLPNQYGSVTKLTGNRRKPYMVRISDGVIFDANLKGYKPKRVVLGYYATKKEALSALAEYNNNPFNIDDANISFGQLYERWKKEKYYQGLSDSAKASREAAARHCAPVWNVKIKEVKTAMLQSILDSCPYGTSTKKNIRTVMHTVFEYAMQNDFVGKDYSEFVRIEHSDPVIDREIFTDEKIQKLWSMSDQWDVRVLLILIYSGLRVNELLKNTRANCNLDERWIYVPKELAKNHSSIRYVPIHDRTFEFVKDFYTKGEECHSRTLIVNDTGHTVPYNNFVSRNLKRINQTLGTTHKMHDTRHTFITMGHTYKLDDLCLQKIVGHSPETITKKVYTHLTFDDLKKEMRKIP